MMRLHGTTDAALPEGCRAFEAVLPEYLDGTLEAAERTRAIAHQSACARCDALVRDLEQIRVTASALPVLQPRRDLWQGIEARLGPQVADRRSIAGTPLRVRSEGATRAGTPWRGAHLPRRVWALAAGLVIATATVTYMGTHWLEARTGVPAPALPTVAVNHTPPATAPAPNPSQGTPKAGEGARLQAPGASLVRPVGHVRAPSTQMYDVQIAALRAIVEQRRGQLDSQTVAVIERNLAVIDTAIAQSKAALAKNPRSRFLADQLDRALDTKVELLQTVALLPSRT